MSDSDQRNNYFGSGVARILSTAVLFTVAIIFVWVRSDRLTANNSDDLTTSSGSVDHGPVLVTNATRHIVTLAIQGPTGERAPTHHSSAEQSLVTAQSRNADVFQNDRLETRPSMSENRTPLFVIRGKLMKKKPYSPYHRSDNTSTGIDENHNTSDTLRIHHKMNIRLNHRQTNNYDYPFIQIDEHIADKDVLNNNQNTYDLTYDESDKRPKENKNLIDRINSTTFFNKLGQIIPEGLWLLKTPKRSGSFGKPPFGLKTYYQNTKHLENKFEHDVNRDHKILEEQLTQSFPLPKEFNNFKTHPIQDTQQDSLILQHPGISTVENDIWSSPRKTTIEIPSINEVIWRRIGLMALIKLGLVKMKTIGFIKILFLVLFKLKFVLITLFLKFITLLKFVKFSILQLLILPLTAIIFFMTMKATPMDTPLMNNLNNNNNPGTIPTLNTLIPTNKDVSMPSETTFFFDTIPSGETILIPSVEEILIPSVEEVLIPSVEEVLIPSSQESILFVPSGETITIPANDNLPLSGGIRNPIRSTISVIPNSNTQSDIENIDFRGGLQYEPIEVLDPTLDLFQKELNSETCVERIACKIAATGKTGIIPLGMNWILHQVSKPVSNDKLLYYLKAYDDVINEIQTKSPNPDNWETWCLERYDCSSTDKK